MWFRNLIVYRLPADFSLSAGELEERLGQRPLQDCGAFDIMNKGWIAPSSAGRLIHTVNQQHLVALGVNQKLLPASIIRQETATRSQELAASQGFPVGRRQMRDLRMRVTEELRARALTRRRSTRAWLDLAGGWFVVDAASPGKAEEVVETLRDTLDSFAVQFVETLRTPHTSMAAWLNHGDAPGSFAIEQDLELQTADKSKSSIRYTRHALDGPDVRTHLSNGKYPTRLGLSWNGRIAFVLTDKMILKRLEFLEMAQDAAQGDEKDEAEQFDIDFAVMAGELGKLLTDLIQAFGGEQVAQAAAA
jgi:recombination associated protein RdgC